MRNGHEVGHLSPIMRKSQKKRGDGEHNHHMGSKFKDQQPVSRIWLVAVVLIGELVCSAAVISDVCIDRYRWLCGAGAEEPIKQLMTEMLLLEQFFGKAEDTVVKIVITTFAEYFWMQFLKP
uniref:G_PROTEIN_RECEP_F1_2 domain-containing protein n=1 Tax=Syphacia muris TaxID=451379 RepID=A0A0N5AAA6_9BILA